MISKLWPDSWLEATQAWWWLQMAGTAEASHSRKAENRGAEQPKKLIFYSNEPKYNLTC